MATLLKGKGHFNLSDNDNNIGSLFSIKDIAEILEIDKIQESNFHQALVNLGLIKNDYVDEKDLYKHWKCLKKLFSSKPISGNSSLDEYILLAIFRRTFPEATIEQQVKLGSMRIDFKITYQGITKYIEFDGPSHFTTYRGKTPEAPQIRIKKVAEFTGCELVRWPFWIQRCSQNARVIFDQRLKGYGALWTSTKYFHEFTIPNPSATIKELTRRFNAEDKNGIGYFYEKKEGPRYQPPHNLLSTVKKDHSKIVLFIPNDAHDHCYWLPKEMWGLLNK